MTRHFEEVEEELKRQMLKMGSLAEEMIQAAVRALTERNPQATDEVFQKEELVNQLHIQIDEMCLNLLALHQPIAVDLRFTLAAVKVNTDLERIADQAVNISQNTLILLDLPRLEKKLLDIPRMAKIAQLMLKESLDALVRKDVDLARSVIARDNEEDRLKSEAFHELMQIMQADSSTIQCALGLILISRNLEKIADHSTNIAEDVIFMVQGKDIRHNQESLT